MSKKLQIGILNKFTFENTSHFLPWTKYLDADFHLLQNYGPDWKPGNELDILISHLHYQAPEASILRRIVFEENSLPVLILSDGILEYRNTWYKPAIPPGSIFQPVLGHKIATIGRSATRMLESWGNIGKCETVGLPRLDVYLSSNSERREFREVRRILVTTAKTPGFTEKQMQAVRESLKDLKRWFDAISNSQTLKIEPIWRLTGNLSSEIGVEESVTDLSGKELSTVLSSVDALVTTPSTVMLEGMLKGIPVALLDYNNCPHYVPAAWEITAPQHIDQVIPGMIRANAQRMLYQDTILHDALECHTPAAGRMVKLVKEMAAIGKACRLSKKPLVFPDQILPDPQKGHHLPESRFDMQQLFPDHPVFGNLDRVALQVEIGHLQIQIRHLKERLKVCEDRFSRSLFFRTKRKLSHLKRKLL